MRPGVVLNENGNLVIGPEYKKEKRMRISEYLGEVAKQKEKDQQRKKTRFLPHLKRKEAEQEKKQGLKAL